MYATFKGVSSRRLRDELNGCGLAFLDLGATLRRGKNKAGIARTIGALWVRADPETVRMVGGCDLELDFRALFDSDWGWSEVIFLGGNFDDLDIPSCGGRLILRAGNSAACQKYRCGYQQRGRKEIFHNGPSYLMWMRPEVKDLSPSRNFLRCGRHSSYGRRL